MQRSLLLRNVIWCFAPMALAAIVAPDEAMAGRRPFLFVYDSEIVPEGDVELEQWLWAEGKVPANPQRPAIYWLWWAPVVGVTNRLEIAVPLQFVATANSTALQELAAEVRCRLLPREQDGGLQPLVRFAYIQAIQARDRPSSLEFNLVNAYGRANQIHFSLDLGLHAGLPDSTVPVQPVYGTYSAGVAYPLPGGELKISAEFHGEAGFIDTLRSQLPRHSIGAAISWTRGRIWVTAGSLFGLTFLSDATPRFQPRLLWAVAL